jgi:hypothetical protein
MVDAPDGRHQGYYRSGALQADSTVAVWRPWAAVADWYFWENQGAGIAVADLDGGGTPELVVVAVNNPPLRSTCSAAGMRSCRTGGCSPAVALSGTARSSAYGRRPRSIRMRARPTR